MNKSNEFQDVFFHYLSTGSFVLGEPLDQIENLCFKLSDILEDEKACIEDAKQCYGDYTVNTSDMRLYKTCMVLFMVNYIESLCNFLAQFALRMNEFESNSEIKYRLEQIEKEYLVEEKSIIKNGEIKEKVSFVSIVDKLEFYPKILGKVFGVEFKIDKSGRGWQSIIHLKKCRDELTHVKFKSDITINKKSAFVEDFRYELFLPEDEILEYATAIQWYTDNIAQLVNKIINCAGLKISNPIYEQLNDGCYSIIEKIGEMFDISKENNPYWQCVKEAKEYRQKSIDMLKRVYVVSLKSLDSRKDTVTIDCELTSLFKNTDEIKFAGSSFINFNKDNTVLIHFEVYTDNITFADVRKIISDSYKEKYEIIDIR